MPARTRSEYDAPTGRPQPGAAPSPPLPAMRTLRVLAVALPVLCAALPLPDEGPRPAPPPPVRAIDVWMQDVEVRPGESAWARAAREEELLRLGPRPVRPIAAPGLGSGFQVVGSVAVLEGDETTTTARGTRLGVTPFDNLPAVSRRFIEAFGDHFDQLAVFLTFTDAESLQALAYLQYVKNDTRGIGLGLFDHSARFGTSGRLQAVLNMKRIVAYGRDAAEDEDNSLYYVWAQEAAHRWVVYFRFQRPGDRNPSGALLGRQDSHWARNVQADGSIMDGYLWTDNNDGTFTPVERGKRYGELDQYGMGLRRASEVRPFFFLEELRDEQDRLVDRSPIARGARYKARRVDVTVEDIVRALGPREPAIDPAAQDLRMGVVLLTGRGVPPEQVIGESYRIDLTRRLWTEFYNNAGGGRGKVCTELLRPCRGPSFTFGAPELVEEGKARDGVVAPGEAVSLKVTVTNAGTERGAPRVTARGHGRLVFAREAQDAPPLDPGQSAVLTWSGRVALGTPCGQPLTVDLETVEKQERPGPSKGSLAAVVGLVRGPLDDLERGAAGWRVDPDGTDTADSGRWELGAPERTEAFEFVLQPGGAWSGRNAFVTGAARGNDPSDNDVHGGRTTLESPPFPLAGLRAPGLSYQVYFVAADFDREVLFPGAGDSLQVLASADGTRWIEVDRVTGMALRWERRIVRLADRLPPDVLAAGALRFRFVAEDGGLNDNIVEAVIDDVGLVDEAPTCGLPAPDGGVADPEMPVAGGCDCRAGRGGAGSAGVVLAGAAALALALRRRRRRDG